MILYKTVMEEAEAEQINRKIEIYFTHKAGTSKEAAEELLRK